MSGAMDPQKGSVVFAGEEISRQEPDYIARLGISHVPEGREVFPFMSVLENLRMGAYRPEARAQQNSNLSAVFRYFPILKERAKQPAIALSGG
ncbi:ABC transporter ATP-binding protein, partial [Arthrospira platensis SPKY2]